MSQLICLFQIALIVHFNMGECISVKLCQVYIIQLLHKRLIIIFCKAVSEWVEQCTAYSLVCFVCIWDYIRGIALLPLIHFFILFLRPRFSDARRHTM